MKAKEQVTEDNLWKKIKHSAKKAGKELIRNVLILWQCMTVKSESEVDS